MNSKLFLLKRNNFKLTNYVRHMSNIYENVPTFKSNYSLDKIYSESDKNLHKKEPKDVDCKEFKGHIPVEKLDIKYCRSSGPGGQHVNKTNTKVTIKFHLESANWIPREARDKLAILHKNSINKQGFWLVRSEKTRDQQLNMADCMDKLRCYITEASKPTHKPSSDTLEIIRLRREKAAEERLKQKRLRSQIKRDRQEPEFDI